MKKLFLVLTVLLLLSFTSSDVLVNDNQTGDEAVIGCYLTYTVSEWNPYMQVYIETTYTQYLGEVNYELIGTNIAACKTRAALFIASL